MCRRFRDVLLTGELPMPPDRVTPEFVKTATDDPNLLWEYLLRLFERHRETRRSFLSTPSIEKEKSRRIENETVALDSFRRHLCSSRISRLLHHRPCD